MTGDSWSSWWAYRFGFLFRTPSGGVTVMTTDWQLLLSQLQGLGLRILVVNREDGTVVCQVPKLQ